MKHPKIETLLISDIRCDDRAQPRVKLHEEVIIEYAEAMKRGECFPPITVFYDGEAYWLANGFHRIQAAIKNGSDSIQAEVRSGELRAAILRSASANFDHGLRRSNEDKRRAVATVLRDDEW